MPFDQPRPVDSLRFVIEASGFADGPAQPLRDYLVARGAAVTTIFHPLVQEGPQHHLVAVHRPRTPERRYRMPFPSRPPLTYPFDVVLPPALPRCDVWVGFNNLAAAKGLVARRAGRAGAVVYWAVDFVPDRFGAGALTRAYDAVDRWVCREADLRVELAAAGREGRDQRHGLRDGGPAVVVPMGFWAHRTPTTDPDAWRRRRAVFMGHLVERMGVDTFVDAIARLRREGDEITADIVGGGPLEDEIRARVAVELGDAVRVHGFVPDFGDVARILAGASVAVAPYRRTADNFTAFADPGKLKVYLGAGLPVVLTDVPPNAKELERDAGAEVVDDAAEALAAGIAAVLADGPSWARRREAALRYAQQFDWNVLLPRALEAVGVAT